MDTHSYLQLCCIYSKYLNSLIPYHSWPKLWTKFFQLPVNIGIKHDFSCMNIRQVPREVLKTEAAVFNTSLWTWRMLMHWKTMLDHYYCIKTENICYISPYFLHYFVLPFHDVAGKGRGVIFLFLLFLLFLSCSSFLPVPVFHLLNYLFYLFFPFLWETTQNDPQGLTCR